MFDKEGRSKGEIGKEVMENTKLKTPKKGESDDFKIKGDNGLIRVPIKRGETDNEIKIRKDRLYDAIKMQEQVKRERERERESEREREREREQQSNNQATRKIDEL
jgi:hypothetical protein